MFESGWTAGRLAWVLDRAPSAATQAVRESLGDRPLPRDLQVLAAKAWERHEQDDADAELALALRRTDNEMVHQLHQDRRLMTLPVLYGVLRAGDCTPRHVSGFLDITCDVLPDDLVAIDAAVSARAASMTVSGFRRIVRKTTAKLDARSPEQKQQARRPRIGVRCQPQPDGLITIAATMPAVDGIAYATELNRRADAFRTPEDNRTHGERQIDVLSCSSSSTGGHCWVRVTTLPSCSATARSPRPTSTPCSPSRAGRQPAASTTPALIRRPARRWWTTPLGFEYTQEPPCYDESSPDSGDT